MAAKRCNRHFEGLGAAARVLFAEGFIDSKLKRKLISVDGAYNIARHITNESANILISMMQERIDSEPKNIPLEPEESAPTESHTEQRTKEKAKEHRATQAETREDGITEVEHQSGDHDDECDNISCSTEKRRFYADLADDLNNGLVSYDEVYGSDDVSCSSEKERYYADLADDLNKGLLVGEDWCDDCSWSSEKEQFYADLRDDFGNAPSSAIVEGSQEMSGDDSSRHSFFDCLTDSGRL